MRRRGNISMRAALIVFTMDKKVVLLTLLLLSALRAAAFDFSAVAPSGQTLYYNYVTGGVEVTYPATVTQPTNGWSGYTKPTGALSVPEAVTYGGVSYDIVAVHGFAFYECTGLTSVVLPEGVASIGNSAFNGCTSLSQLTLPSTLQTIGGATFYGCTALAHLYCNAIAPPTAVGSTFQNASTSTCVLHVPCQQGDSYLTTTPWSQFGTIDLVGCSAVISVAVNYPNRGSVDGGGTYDVGTTATLTAMPNEGYFFACWNDGDTINPRTITVNADESFTAWFFALQYDTVQVHDTTTLYDTITVVAVHEDTVYVHDTTTVNMLVWDTVFITDTTTIHDTLLPTFFRLQVTATTGGVGIGNALLPAGTVAEIGALPLEGYSFTAWSDGNIDNPRQVTLTGNQTYTAEFTIVTGIEEVQGQWGVTVDGRMLSVECEAGSTVAVFSSDGRQLMQHTAGDGRLRVWMPAAGVYLVQVDNMPARKIVITK